MLGAQAAAMNTRSRQEVVDANPDTWSIYGLAGDPGHLAEYNKQAEYLKKYTPWHLTWTHQCNSSPWNQMSDTEVRECGRCCNFIRKHFTLDNIWRTVSKLYFPSPYNNWYYYCAVCNEFFDRRSHCGVESLDVHALKHARASRARF